MNGRQAACWMEAIGLCAVLISLLPGCASIGPPTAQYVRITSVSLAPAVQPSPAATRLAALLEGVVAIEGQCVTVAGYPLVWPVDITGVVKDDSVWLKDETTGESAVWRTGDQIQMGGGELVEAGMTEEMAKDIAARCGSAKIYWLVASVGEVLQK